MKFALLLTAILLSAPLVATAAGDVKTFVITANDSLRFSLNHIEASPGEMVHVQLHNAGTLPKDAMGHNWVLLTAGESPDAYAASAMNAKADNFQPLALKNKVLAVVPLLGPGESGDVTFAAPMTPGKYAFLCSFPAHCAAGMRGTLTVR